MKNWLNNKKLMLGMAFFLLIVILIIIFGVDVLGYIGVLLIFGGLYMASNQAENENIISPREIENASLEIQEIEEEIELIEEHIKENPGDLEAKFILRELKKEKEEIENGMPRKK